MNYYENKPKMAWFLKFKFLFTLKLNFNGVYFIKKYKTWFFQKVEQSHNKIVKFAVKWSSKLKFLSICVEHLNLKSLS